MTILDELAEYAGERVLETLFVRYQIGGSFTEKRKLCI